MVAGLAVAVLIATQALADMAELGAAKNLLLWC